MNPQADMRIAISIKLPRFEKNHIQETETNKSLDFRFYMLIS